MLIDEWKTRKRTIEKAERKRLMELEQNGEADVNTLLQSSLRKIHAKRQYEQ